MYVDVHCHLPKDIFPQYKEVLDRAAQAGVVRVIVNGINFDDNLTISTWEHPLLRKAFGLHPCSEYTDVQTIMTWIKDNRKACVAIGEIGLDGHWRPETLPEQTQRFKLMLTLSKELKLPVIIHSRKAEEQVLDIVENHPTPVLLHAFGGKKKLVERAIKQGCYLSIPGNVVRSEQTQALAKMIPLKQLFTETDAPYLSKERGVPSEPRDVVDAIKMIAQIQGLTEQECAQIIFMNYQRIFGN